MPSQPLYQLQVYLDFLLFPSPFDSVCLFLATGLVFMLEAK